MGRPLLRDEVPVGPCKVRALFSWSGETPQDLGFVEGDIIEVLNNGDGDWWTGKLKRNKLVGVFPRNFAEYVDENQATMSAALTEKNKMKKKLTNYSLEGEGGETIDFSSFSLADLQIPDPSSEKSERAQTATATATATAPATANTSSRSRRKSNSFVPSPQPVSLSASQSSGTSIGRLGSSQNSQRSTKSAQEILQDVTKELNGGFLDDINFDAKPEDLRTPELCGDAAFPALDNEPETQGEDAPPAPPPHRVSVNSRKSGRHSRATSLVPEDPIDQESRDIRSPVSNSAAFELPEDLQFGMEPRLDSPPTSSALTGPVIKPKKPASSQFGGVDLKDPSQLGGADISVERSPNLDQEIPFDPKAFKSENTIGDHIGSHIDSSAYTSNLADPSEPPLMNVPKTRSSKNISSGATGAEDNSIATASSTVIYPHNKADEKGGESKKSNFFQKLFPKNSQNFLRRSFSRSSHKSSKSTKSSKLRNVKSIFSFAFPHSDDDSLYPTNEYTQSRDSVIGSTAAPKVGNPIPPPRISTPPRANLAGLGLSSPLKNSRPKEDTAFGGTTQFRSSGGSTAGNAPAIGAISGTGAGESIAGKWMETRRNLYRAKTLTDHDMQKRRQELELQGINSDNIVETLNMQNLSDFHDYRLEDFEEVDQAVRTMSTWPQLMTPSVFASSRIGRHFRDPVERIRAVFLLCATRIQHVPQTAPGNNVMQTRQATPQELANTVMAMCSALDVECVTIDGQRRTVLPGSHDITSTTHAWNAVKVNDEWRLLDAVAAADAAAAAASTEEEEDDDGEINLFYFLTPPSQLIYSHVPHDHHRQFCEPLLPTASAALLPLASPGVFAHGIYFNEFWLGMTRLSDLEVAELSLSVPDGSKDLVALVNGNKPALAQAYWTESSQRHFRVKAFVPPQQKKATLQIYVVPKSQTNRSPDAMELLWTVELRHVSGGNNNPAYDFAGRYGVPTVPNFDLYILEPQCRQLGGGDTYTFKVEAFDSRGAVAPGPPKRNKQPNLAIQSPSGRLTRLIPLGTDLPDTFRATVKTLEVGTWRSVVRANESQSWVPFAEWFCS